MHPQPATQKEFRSTPTQELGHDIGPIDLASTAPSLCALLKRDIAQREAVLKATAVRINCAGNVINSSLFINSSWSSLSSTSHAVFGGGGTGHGGVQPWGSHRGRGVPGGGGRGHFGPAAIYCTTTWCFALKGHCTMTLPWHNTLAPQELEADTKELVTCRDNRGLRSSVLKTPCSLLLTQRVRSDATSSRPDVPRTPRHVL